jgi:Domain of unknown function (DUF1830)
MQTISTVPQDALPIEDTLCCYQNRAPHLQIIRIANIPNWYFERVVFPGQQILFEAPAEAKLEVHTGTSISSILTDTICCDRLRVPSGSKN